MKARVTRKQKMFGIRSFYGLKNVSYIYAMCLKLGMNWTDVCLGFSGKHEPQVNTFPPTGMEFSRNEAVPKGILPAKGNC